MHAPHSESVAAFLGAGEPNITAKHTEQVASHFGMNRIVRSIDVKREGLVHRRAPTPIARFTGTPISLPDAL